MRAGHEPRPSTSRLTVKCGGRSVFILVLSLRCCLTLRSSPRPRDSRLVGLRPAAPAAPEREALGSSRPLVPVPTAPPHVRDRGFREAQRMEPPAARGGRPRRHHARLPRGRDAAGRGELRPGPGRGRRAAGICRCSRSTARRSLPSWFAARGSAGPTWRRSPSPPCRSQRRSS